MPSTHVRRRLELREESLSRYASRSRDGIRERPEQPDTLRGEFQRDRDRIIHSLSFRRLKHKTQVFIAPTSDHYVTRLTHTLEVAQISRTIARALNLNEDLAEAIALGHDIGHTPFGHVGEKLLDSLDPAGFRHAEQSLRTVERLEKRGLGLNLTRQVRQGIVSHSKPRGDVLGDTVPRGLSLEGQICRISDAVAYLNHDLSDAFRAGTLREQDMPGPAMKILGDRHSIRIHTMVTDIVENSWAATGEIPVEEPSIEMSPRIRTAVNTLRDFMFERVYLPSDLGEEGQAARGIVALLYHHLQRNSDQIPEEYQDTDKPVVDFIAGMTDHYAIRMAEHIQPDIAAVFRMARP